MNTFNLLIVIFLLTLLQLSKADSEAFQFQKECECVQTSSTNDFCMKWNCIQWTGNDKDGTSSSCFNENQKVIRRVKSSDQYEEIEIKYLEKGDRIISIDSDNNIIDDVFIDFLHYDKTETQYQFKVLTLANQQQIQMTNEHLIAECDDQSNQLKGYKQIQDIKIGEYICYKQQKNGVSAIKSVRVESISNKLQSRVYAPLTKGGNLIVDNTLASSFAKYNHQYCQILFKPYTYFRSVFKIQNSQEEEVYFNEFVRFMKSIENVLPDSIKNMFIQ